MRCLMKWFSPDHGQRRRPGAHPPTAEQGKPLAEARGEIRYGAGFIEWFAEEGRRVCGETIPSTDNGKRYLVLKQPVGGVRGHHAVEFPQRDDHPQGGAGAGQAGCPVVIKPAEQTPLSALALAELAQRAEHATRACST